MSCNKCQTTKTTCTTSCDHTCGQGCPRCETTRDFETRQCTTVHEHVDEHGIITEVYEKPVTYHTRIDHPATLVTHTVERSRLEEGTQIIGEKVECVDVGSEHVVSVQESGPTHVVATHCTPCKEKTSCPVPQTKSA